MLYLALTGQSAYDILWSEILDECEKEFIPHRPNKVERKIYFPEVKSSLKLAGADASEREMKKILGNKFSMVGIDEAGSFTIDMTKLVYQMIRPTLVDVNGKLVLSGTCENIPNTFFEKVCNGTIKGWSVHRWTAADNPYVSANWNKEIEEILKTNPDAINAAWFRTHYLNEWVTDDSKLIIPLKKENLINELPKRIKTHYGLGVDLGFNDATSFTVVDYSFHFPDIRIIKSYKLRGMDITDTVNEIKRLESIYDFTHMVVDGANKQAVEEMRARHNLPLKSAEKIEKGTHLRIMKDEFAQKRICVYEPECQDLITEWNHLIWVDQFGIKEDPRCENHCSDGALYIFREVKHYFHEDIKEINPDTNEFMDKFEEMEALKMEEEEYGEKKSIYY